MNITQYIAHTGKTAEQIGKESGVDGSQISRWRSGENEPMKSRVEPIEKATSGLITFEDVYQEFRKARKALKRREKREKRKGRAA